MDKPREWLKDIGINVTAGLATWAITSLLAAYAGGDYVRPAIIGAASAVLAVALIVFCRREYRMRHQWWNKGLLARELLRQHATNIRKSNDSEFPEMLMCAVIAVRGALGPDEAAEFEATIAQGKYTRSKAAACLDSIATRPDLEYKRNRDSKYF